VQQVASRHPELDARTCEALAHKIAVAALRFFMLRVTRNTVIAFDFADALSFDGETGPYLQYSVVRARNIFRKFQESHPGFNPRDLDEQASMRELAGFFSGKDAGGFWELVVLAAQLEMVAEQAIASQEPAVVAKYAFRLAQAFNNFYHHHHILSEEDASRQSFLLYLVHVVNETLTKTIGLLGIEVPERM